MHHRWGLAAAIGVGLVAAKLTLSEGLPYGHDSSLHLYRAVVWNFLIQHTLEFRWCPFLSYGYGSPLFNYYPPLFYVFSQSFLQAGLEPMLGLRMVLGLALVGASVGMYAWVSDLFGPGPAIVAATAFTFSPYAMCTLLNRASFPEVVNLAWMPWGAWALHRYAGGRGLAYAAFSTVVTAAALLSHLFSVYLFIASMLVYVIGLSSLPGNHVQATANRASFGQKLRYLKRLWELGWPIVLGLGLAAFFWLPAMWEVGWVQVERMLLIADPAAGQGLVPLWQVFAAPLLPDASLPVAVVPPRLSGVAALLGLVGAVSGFVALRSGALKMHLVAGIVVVGLAGFMHTPASRWLWQNLPLLRLGQFPFRFLSAGGLWLALLAGSGAGALLATLPAEEMPGFRNRLPGIALVLGLSLALAAYSLGWPSVAVHPPGMPTDLAAALSFEREPTTMGLQTGGEYRIRTVRELPPPESGPGLDSLRLDAASLPAGARVVAADYDWFRYSLTIESPRPFQAIFRTFDFPGWQARVDGRRVPITPTYPVGLISLPVRAGRQQVELAFGSTPVRAIGTGLSLASVFGLAGVFVLSLRRRQNHGLNAV
jgi:hypothetical protein